jgi:hypothetical protein
MYRLWRKEYGFLKLDRAMAVGHRQSASSARQSSVFQPIVIVAPGSS